MRNRRSAVVAADGFDDLLVSCVAWGELLLGAQQSFDPAAESRKITERFADEQIVGVDQETAAIYGELLTELERAGRRIPTNDIWIAATAVQFDLPLLARDGHFGRLAALRWLSY